jgi:crotonobetainyl-CoA:carnitine CoA-transferase CaiB-like acyl-CoA transferase
MQPYEGLKVTEVVGHSSSPAIGLAIAMCGRVLADLGAQVSVIGPDSETRQSGFLRRGKRFLATEAGETLTAHCIRTSDVALVDHALWPMPVRCRAMATMAMDHSDDAGQKVQSEFMIEARSGLLDIVGDPHRAPLRLGGHQTAFAAGLAAFTGITASLVRKRHAVVHVSLLEVATWLNWKAIATACGTGQAPSRRGDLERNPITLAHTLLR